MTLQEVSHFIAENRELSYPLTLVTHELNWAKSIISTTRYTLPISTADDINPTLSYPITYYNRVTLSITTAFLESNYDSLLTSLRTRLFTSDLFDNNNTLLILLEYQHFLDTFESIPLDPSDFEFILFDPSDIIE